MDASKARLRKYRTKSSRDMAYLVREIFAGLCICQALVGRRHHHFWTSMLQLFSLDLTSIETIPRSLLYLESENKTLVMASHFTTKRSALIAAQYPVLDFLAPRLLSHPHARYISTTPQRISQDHSNNTVQSEQSQNESRKSRKPLSKAHRDFLDSAVCNPASSSSYHAY